MRLIVDDVQNLPPSASKRDIEASTNAARWAGFEVTHIEPDFSRCGNSETALWMLNEKLEGERACRAG